MVAVGGAVLALLIVAVLVRKGPAGAERMSPAASRAEDSTRGAAAAPAPASTPARSLPIPSGLRRYAQTWVNVRGDRTRSAPTVAMLNPGDAVTVDSLVRGWYRVLSHGRTLGYVHRSMLDVSRPE